LVRYLDKKPKIDLSKVMILAAAERQDTEDAIPANKRQKWALPARHGYFAPRGECNPEAAAKEEIQQAVFSQEELRELPIEYQAQFFKGAGGVHLTVVTHVGTEERKFPQVDGGNQDTLTITTAILDENGRMLAGLQRVLDMRFSSSRLAGPECPASGWISSLRNGRQVPRHQSCA
jgi:hypothetical protein